MMVALLVVLVAEEAAVLMARVARVVHRRQRSTVPLVVREPVLAEALAGAHMAVGPVAVVVAD